MKVSKLWNMLIVVIMILSLIACNEESELVSATIREEDFILTFESPFSIIQSGDEIILKASLEYVGEDNEVTITSSMNFHALNMIDKDGERLYGVGRDDTLVSTILKKGTKEHFEYKISDKYPKGIYKLIIDLEFTLLDDSNQNYDMETEVEIKIKE